MTIINVRINPLKDYPTDLGSNMYECWLIERLKSDGIPIIGTLTFKGIKYGTLISTNDLENGDIIYIWVDK